MAGSMARYTYIAEDGESYALKCDRSNVNAVNPAGAVVLASSTLVGLPNTIKPRYVLYRSANGKVTRKCYLLQPVTDINTLPATYTVPVTQGGTNVVNVALNKSFYSGEKYTFTPNAVDTALVDSGAADTI